MEHRTGLFVGLTTIDIILAFDAYPLEDTKTTARQQTIAAGGPATNASVIFSRLGGRSRLISSLGISSIGEIARSDLFRYQVEHADLTPTHEEEPPLSAIAVAADTGSRTIFTSPAINTARLGPFDESVLREYVTGTDIVLLDGHQTRLALDIARTAHHARIPVVLDGDLYRRGIEKVLPYVDVAIFGKTFKIEDNADSRSVFDYFTSFGIRYVAATHGGDAIEYLLDGAIHRLDVPTVSVVDTLGAGDFFHGAFCFSFCEHRSFPSALAFAASVASQSVTSFGTRDWMKSL